MNIEKHLIERHVDLFLHNPAIDEDEQLATFYLYDLAGHITGYQQYRPTAGKEKKNNPKVGRYFTYRTKSTIGVFGAESLHFRDDILFVTEGIFDACRLTELGYPAVAVLTNHPTPDVRNWLVCLGRKIICVCDSGQPGRKLASAGHRSITCPEDQDLSSASDEFVQTVLDLI